MGDWLPKPTRPGWHLQLHWCMERGCPPLGHPVVEDVYVERADLETIQEEDGVLWMWSPMQGEPKRKRDEVN